MSQSEDEENQKVMSEEYVSSFCEIVQGGKAPKVVFGCRVQVHIDKIDKVPDLVIENIRETWKKAQDNNLVF